MNNISFPKLGLEFNIDPIALRYSFLGGGIHWYGIIIALCIVLAVLYCRAEAKRVGENPDLISDLVLYAIPVSVIFARTYYVIFSWDDYKDNLKSVFYIWEGGIAIYGAVIGAVLTAWIFFRAKKRSVLKMFDICCMGLLIGQAIGRWGNFVNCEAFGGPCSLPWGMSINGAPPVHPTFLYESLWNAAGFVILHFLGRKKPFDGFVFFSYLTWYGAGRFFIEGMRTDSLYWGNIRVSQLVALLCILCGITVLSAMFTRKRKEKEKISTK